MGAPEFQIPECPHWKRVATWTATVTHVEDAAGFACQQCALEKEVADLKLVAANARDEALREAMRTCNVIIYGYSRNGPVSAHGAGAGAIECREAIRAKLEGNDK